MDTKPIYIVLFKDGSMQPTVLIRKKSDWQNGARFFEVSPDDTIGTLSDWYGMGHKGLLNFKEILKED